jgi:hypothetical protein
VPNFPDWVEDPQTGVWQIPQGTQKPPLRALNACRSYLDQIPRSKSRPAQSSPRPLTTTEVAKARQWAKCIRQHGLPDWPDPNPDGTFELPPRLAQAGKAGFRSQFQACEKYSFGRVRFTAQGNGG